MVIMKNALWKDILRDINKSKGRFISIAAIITLGVMLFTGVKIAPIDMKATADKYYDDYNLMDLKIISTLGLTDKDVKDIKDINSILGVYPSKTMDALSKQNSEEFVIRIHSLPSENLNNNNENYINRVNLVKGKMPSKENECVIGNEKFSSLNLKIGDKLLLTSGDDSDISESLKNIEYEIVGVVETPYYLSNQIGSSTIGNGNVKTYMFINEDNFKNDIYSEVYVTIDGVKNLNSYNDEYFEVINESILSIENISSDINNRRYLEIVNLAKEELENGKKEYEDKKSTVLRQIEDAKKEIEDSKSKLMESQDEISSREQQLYDSIEDGKYKISVAESELKEKEEEYNLGLIAFNEAKKSAEENFAKAEESIRKSEDGLQQLKDQINNLKLSLNDESLTEEIKLNIQEQINSLNNLFEQGSVKLNEAKKQLEQGKNELAKQEENLNAANIQLAAGKKAINSSKNSLKELKEVGEAKIKEAKDKVNEGKLQLEEGEKELLEKEKTANEELDKAKGKIIKAEDEISKIEKPELYVLDRKSHYSYVDFENNAKSINKLSNVFPVFFFIVAGLVCLTTMTRMVDEQRINIGTLKALGYGNGSIAKKFIIYALFASLIGSVIGIALGLTVFPLIIINAYKMMYILPEINYTINIPLILTVFTVAIGVTTFVTYAACRMELRETPSILMRPKAPKEGKRILLEKIPFIWNKLNFIGKVTIRNIFRYKKRFLMTVIGIAGSTALLVAGFGIKDSIKAVVSKQYGELTKYQMSLSLAKDVSKEKIEYIKNELSNDNNVADYLFVTTESGKATINEISKDVSLVISNDSENFNEFELLRNRKTEEIITLPKNSIVISEKIATLLNVKIGDEIEITNNANNKAKATIGYITERYINNYIYISDKYYEDIFGKIPQVNNVLLKLNDEKSVNEISNKFINMDGVTGAVNNTSIKENFDDTIKSLDLVVVVMILCAGALSFIVLYNLTNVNISERVREIATIKVLGFYDNEVSAYIYRENILLTIIGLITGLGLGKLFHKFIMVTVEMDYIMFGRKIALFSFVIAGILTLAFSLLVNLAMYYKLKNIKMVESLKSVD